ncbi:hypothetical protein JCM8547_000935 [Rhodosporidiobolus lusitaniae]
MDEQGGGAYTLCNELGEYHFSTPEQFWSELDDLISVSPDSTLEQLDYALRNYIAFASTFMDEFLAAPGALDHALLALLSSPLFTSHIDRMTQNIITSIVSPHASSSTLFISLMLVLHLGESANPLTTVGISGERRKVGAGVTVGSSKVFRAMRRRWKEVVPVLMKWVSDAAVIEDHSLTAPEGGGGGEGEAKIEKKMVGMPAEGWEERVGTAATAVLYEMCRVQKLTADELGDFTFDFISHLFTLVERTRDVEDETFNYSLIKLIIALNEQFMVATVPSSSSGQSSGNGNLPPPILPTVSKGAKRERGTNLVLEVLKEKEDESKTFGENVIFILNRADGTPDSLCVSLLILKILYLLFTTSGTQEFFYTNDLCVLVDVFIRELCDLGEESEGLKHTYLRVLHPLLTNTQLRNHPYKRPQLRRVLETLVAPSLYRDVDPTTRRLVERNLRGSWCQGLRAADAAALGSGSGEKGSTLSVDAIATAADDGGKVRHKHRHGSHHPHRKSRRQTSLDDSSSSAYSSSASSTPYTAYSTSTAPTSAYLSSPLSVADGRAALQPTAERAAAGDVPYYVRASHAASSGLTASPELAPSALPPHAYADDPSSSSSLSTSIPSIRAGHDLLTPVAERALSSSYSPSSLSPSCRAPSPRAVSSTHPPHSSSSAGLATPITHPRPRSTSLSAATYRSSTHSLGLTDSPPPPLPPPSPSSSIASLASSSGAPVTKTRRRAPPPPPEGATSRPRTPSFAVPNTPAPESVPQSPQVTGTGTATGTRRRPPPPPVAGGRGSPMTGRGGGRAGGGNALGFMEVGVEGLSVKY